jgi:hypothetical protein
LSFLNDLSGRRAAAQDVVAGDPVEDMDAMIVQQGGLGHGPFGAGAALLTLLERFGADFLDRFEAVAFGAIGIRKSGNDLVLGAIKSTLLSQRRPNFFADLAAAKKILVLKFSCLLINNRAAQKAQARSGFFFYLAWR